MPSLYCPCEPQVRHILSIIIQDNTLIIIHLDSNGQGIEVRSLLTCGLLLLALSIISEAIAPIEIGGERGQAVLAMIANRPLSSNSSDSSDLWSWGGSPTGFGQLFPGEGSSNDFGGWAPEGETPLEHVLSETPLGYTINETKHLFSGQGQSWNSDWSTARDENVLGESNRLFPKQGFFNGYGGWEPAI